jgi:hypothetical protein
MVFVVEHFYHFVTVWTWFRLTLASLIVIPIFVPGCRKRAILALDNSVALFFVFFFVGLGYALPTFTTLIILPRASDFVHSKF